MFKNFIKRIIAAENQEDAMQNVFYGSQYDESGKITEYSINLAYQHDMISWNEFNMLLDLIKKMA